MHPRRYLSVAELLASVELSCLLKYSTGFQPKGCYYSRISLVAKVDVSARKQDGREGSKRPRTGAEAKEDLRPAKAAH